MGRGGRSPTRRTARGARCPRLFQRDRQGPGQAQDMRFLAALFTDPHARRRARQSSQLRSGVHTGNRFGSDLYEHDPRVIGKDSNSEIGFERNRRADRHFLATTAAISAPPVFSTTQDGSSLTQQVIFLACQCMFMPPSTPMAWPVMKLLSSEARKITVSTISDRYLIC